MAWGVPTNFSILSATESPFRQNCEILLRKKRADRAKASFPSGIKHADLDKSIKLTYFSADCPPLPTRTVAGFCYRNN
jgi:hypothetical protein